MDSHILNQSIVTQSAQETQKIAYDLAKHVLRLPKSRKAFVIGLQGDLGSGKTTFAQGFAKGLGIKEKILSPTFVILKQFQIHSSCFQYFYHIDCYRIESVRDIFLLGWKEIINNPSAVILTEWPERIRKALPRGLITIAFKTLASTKRELRIQ